MTRATSTWTIVVLGAAAAAAMLAICQRSDAPRERAHEHEADREHQADHEREREREPRCRTTRASPTLRATEVIAICDDVYAERGLDEASVTALTAAVNTAADAMHRAFGTLRASPILIFCKTAECKIAFGAPPGAAAANDLGFASAQVIFDDGALAASAVVVTGPVEGTARILTHEWVHAEMKAFASYDALPTWFNEGAATFLADEPRCDHAAATEAGAVGVDAFDVTRLRTKASWQRHLAATGETRATYCAARQTVATWMQRFDSDAARTTALRALLTAVAGGAPFDAAFAAP